MESKAKCNQCSKLFENADALTLHKQQNHPNIFTDADLEQVAKTALWDFLTSDGTDKGLRERAKQAGALLSVQARREQTASARDATMVMMARELAMDKQQFREYIRVAMPSSPMLKALPSK